MDKRTAESEAGLERPAPQRLPDPGLNREKEGTAGAEMDQETSRWRKSVNKLFTVVVVALLLWYFLGGQCWDWLVASREESMAKAGEFWATTEGRLTGFGVEEIRVGRGRGSRTAYTIYANYRYFVGEAREGKRIRLCQERWRERAHAEAQAARFPLGATVQVRFDPADPSESVLELAPLAECRETTYEARVMSLFMLLIIWPFAFAIIFLALRNDEK